MLSQENHGRRPEGKGTIFKPICRAHELLNCVTYIIQDPDSLFAQSPAPIAIVHPLCASSIDSKALDQAKPEMIQL